jgi:hypothetical protein
MKKSLFVFVSLSVLIVSLSSCIGLSGKEIVNNTSAAIAVYTTLDPTKTYTLEPGQSVTVNEPNWSSVYAVQNSLPADVRVASRSYYIGNGKVEVTEFFELTDTYDFTITNNSGYKLYVFDSVYGISRAEDDRNTLEPKPVTAGNHIPVSVYTEHPVFKAYYLINDSDPESKKVFTTQFTAVRVITND